MNFKTHPALDRKIYLLKIIKELNMVEIMRFRFKLTSTEKKSLTVTAIHNDSYRFLLR